MAGKTARKKADRAGTGASDTKNVSAADEIPVRETVPSEARLNPKRTGPTRPRPCTRSHVLNGRTRKTLRDADAGKNLTRYADEDDLFRKLGIELGQDEA